MSDLRDRGNKILTKDLEVNLHMMGQEAASRLTVAQFLSWQFLNLQKSLSNSRLTMVHTASLRFRLYLMVLRHRRQYLHY